MPLLWLLLFVPTGREVRRVPCSAVHDSGGVESEQDGQKKEGLPSYDGFA
jgi:hypothetical protein